MGETGEHHMLEAGGLLGERLVERGCEWPWVHVHHDEIRSRISRPSASYERGAARARDQERLGFGSVLSEGVPDMTPVARRMSRASASCAALSVSRSSLSA